MFPPPLTALRVKSPPRLGTSSRSPGMFGRVWNSFDRLYGTAIYLTRASLFVSTAMGMPMSLGEQISLLVFMIIASKGAAGVSGAGLATLAAGLQSHRPELLDGMGVIVGIDKFMSECRALTNFTGNAVATLLIGKWTHEIDIDQARAALNGSSPFDELSLEPDGHGAPAESARLSEGEKVAVS